MMELYYIAILLLSGIVIARFASAVKLPDVTGFIIAGLIIGPSILNLIPEHASHQMNGITQAALAFIAFSIGIEINLSKLRKIGFEAIIIAFSQAMGAWIIVFLMMVFLLRQSPPFGIVLAGIAMATAPALTTMVLKQYRAKGSLTSMILIVVALGDAIGIIFFGISVALAKTFVVSPDSFSLSKNILFLFWEIIGSIVLGVLAGWFFSWLNSKVKSDNELLVLTIVLVLSATSFALWAHLSPLLLCMSMGSMFASLSGYSHRVISKMDHFTPPLYIAFFVLAGASFNLHLLPGVGWIGVAYIVLRILGKISGAWLGAIFSSSPDKVRKYLGLTLMPQAGISIGFAMIANDVFPDFGPDILTIITGAVIVLVMVGPYVIKNTLAKAGEINLTDSSASK